MERKEGAVVSSRELLCPSDTPGGSDMIDVSVPWVGGGGVALHILSLSVRMRSIHLPHIKLRGLSHVTDDFPPMNPSLSGQFKRGID